MEDFQKYRRNTNFVFEFEVTICRLLAVRYFFQNCWRNLASSKCHHSGRVHLVDANFRCFSKRIFLNFNLTKYLSWRSSALFWKFQKLRCFPFFDVFFFLCIWFVNMFMIKTRGFRHLFDHWNISRNFLCFLSCFFALLIWISKYINHNKYRAALSARARISCISLGAGAYLFSFVGVRACYGTHET